MESGVGQGAIGLFLGYGANHPTLFPARRGLFF
jgi:hypothetical protein